MGIRPTLVPGKRESPHRHPVRRHCLKGTSRLWMVTLLLGADLTLVACRNGGQHRTELYLLELQVIAEVPRYEVLELSFEHNGAYRNNFFDVDLDATLTSPAGVEHRVKGFFYGRDLWKVRFRPDEAGSWTYSYTFTGTGGFREEGEWNFSLFAERCEGSRSSVVRIIPFVGFLLTGSHIFPIGLQDCIYT